LVSINILPLWGKENILFHTNICGDMFNSPPPPEEVYPAELRGIMLIENTSRSVRRAPEVRNKKILVLLVKPH
jgi:hypothetical protein